MPANRFAPERIVTGHSQDPTVIDRILQKILSRWPIEKCDVESIFAAAIDWTDGSMVPTENINVDEILNSSTGIVRALGCLDFRIGLNIGYESATSIHITSGMVLHRNDYKQVECADTEMTLVDTASITHYTDSNPTEGNPSGLDSDTWYYIYGNMDAAGSFPTITEFLRLSTTAPVDCDGYGLEHPSNERFRFLGSIRTMATGEVRPFDRADDGWVYWRTADTATEYVAQGLGMETGTTQLPVTGGWVKYEDPATTTNTAYHQGVRHIPASADTVEIRSGSKNAGAKLRVRPIGGAGDHVYVVYASGSDSEGGVVRLRVNRPGSTAQEKQTFELYNTDSSTRLDVSGYRERG